MYKRCALGCDIVPNVPQYPFPDHHTFPEQFKAWVFIAGGKLNGASDYEFYSSKVICDIHFDDQFKSRRRLNDLAVPSLYLPEFLETEPLQNEDLLESEQGTITPSCNEYVKTEPLHEVNLPESNGQEIITASNSIDKDPLEEIKDEIIEEDSATCNTKDITNTKQLHEVEDAPQHSNIVTDDVSAAIERLLQKKEQLKTRNAQQDTSIAASDDPSEIERLILKKQLKRKNGQQATSTAASNGEVILKRKPRNQSNASLVKLLPLDANVLNKPLNEANVLFGKILPSGTVVIDNETSNKANASFGKVLPSDKVVIDNESSNQANASFGKDLPSGKLVIDNESSNQANASFQKVLPSGKLVIDNESSNQANASFRKVLPSGKLVIDNESSNQANASFRKVLPSGKVVIDKESSNQANASFGKILPSDAVVVNNKPLNEANVLFGKIYPSGKLVIDNESLNQANVLFEKLAPSDAAVVHNKPANQANITFGKVLSSGAVLIDNKPWNRSSVTFEKISGNWVFNQNNAVKTYLPKKPVSNQKKDKEKKENPTGSSVFDKIDTTKTHSTNMNTGNRVSVQYNFREAPIYEAENYHDMNEQRKKRIRNNVISDHNYFTKSATCGTNTDNSIQSSTQDKACFVNMKPLCRYTKDATTGVNFVTKDECCKERQLLKKSVDTLRKHKTRYENRLKELKDVKNHPTFKKAEAILTKQAYMFLVMQLRSMKPEAKRRRFTEEEKEFAVSVLRLGAAVYKWFSRIFYMPSFLTLRRLLQKERVSNENEVAVQSITNEDFAADQNLTNENELVVQNIMNENEVVVQNIMNENEVVVQNIMNENEVVVQNIMNENEVAVQSITNEDFAADQNLTNENELVVQNIMNENEVIVQNTMNENEVFVQNIRKINGNLYYIGDVNYNYYSQLGVHLT